MKNEVTISGMMIPILRELWRRRLTAISLRWYPIRVAVSLISLIVSGFTLCVSPDSALDTVLLDMPSSLAISIIVVCFMSFMILSKAYNSATNIQIKNKKSSNEERFFLFGILSDDCTV